MEILRRLQNVPASRVEKWVAQYLQRAHLPRSPWAPALQVCLGLFGIGMAANLLNHEYMDVRPLAFVSYVCATALTIPALGMVLDGIWALVRKPLEHFSPEWYARLALLPAEDSTQR